MLTDNLDATGMDKSFTLSADVRIPSFGTCSRDLVCTSECRCDLHHTVFSTRTNDATEIEKLTGLIRFGIGVALVSASDTPSLVFFFFFFFFFFFYFSNRSIFVVTLNSLLT